MPHLRYLNSHDGQRVEKWQFKQTEVPFQRCQREDGHALPSSPTRTGRTSRASAQILCYNEIPTKVNWQYCKLGFDLRTMQYTTFQCNDVVYDMSGKGTLDDAGDAEPARHAERRVLLRERRRQALASSTSIRSASRGSGTDGEAAREHDRVLVRGETWHGAFASEPYEAGWAREAVIFLRLLKLEGDPGGAEMQRRHLARRHALGRGGRAHPRPAGSRRGRLRQGRAFRQLAARLRPLPEGTSAQALVTIHLKA